MKYKVVIVTDNLTQIHIGEGGENPEQLFYLFFDKLSHCFGMSYGIKYITLYENDKVIFEDLSTIIHFAARVLKLSYKLNISWTGEDVGYYHTNYQARNTDTSSYENEKISIKLVNEKNPEFVYLQSEDEILGLDFLMMVTEAECSIARFCTTKFDNENVIPSPKAKDGCEVEMREESLDKNWTMNYYVPTELKKALALFDTNPVECKKILMVMDYMVSQGKI